MDPLATTSDLEDDNESEGESSNNDTDFNRLESDSEDEESKFDRKLARSEEIIVVSLRWIK